MPERQRRQLDPGEDRRVALHALEVEDEQEHQREPRQSVDERGGRGGREQPVAEDREVEHRRRVVALDHDERGQQHAAAIRPPMTTGEFQPEMPPLEMPSTRPVSPIRNVIVPAKSNERSSERPLSSCSTSGRPEAPGEAERHVEPEHPVPGDRHQCAAEYRADHQPDRGHHRVGAHRQAELLAREGVGDDRGGVGEQERAADALQDPPQDQLRAVGREAGAERRERKHEKAADVRLLAAELVRQPPGAEHQHGRGDHVDEDHPHELEQARVQAALEVRQRDDQRARVDRRQQHPEARTRQRPPLVRIVLVATRRRREPAAARSGLRQLAPCAVDSVMVRSWLVRKLILT